MRQRGAELTTVRDKLRHASPFTTSMYLHSDDLRRAKQIGGGVRSADNGPRRSAQHELQDHVGERTGVSSFSVQ